MNKNYPLISVIIPLFNAQKYIKQTLMSVLNQTYTHIEIIVIDDVSTDASLQIVKGLASEYNQIRIHELSTNSGGPAKPRNEGIKIARGEFIAFLDADDIWLPEKLETQIKTMIENDVNFTSSSTILIDENSNIIKSTNILKSLKKKLTKRATIHDLIRWRHIALSTVVLKKDIVKPFDEDTSLIAVEDYYLWLLLLNKDTTRYFFINTPLVHYRLLENSISHSGNILNHETKALYATLKFILANKRFDLLSVFFESIFIHNIKNIFRKSKTC